MHMPKVYWRSKHENESLKVFVYFQVLVFIFHVGTPPPLGLAANVAGFKVQDVIPRLVNEQLIEGSAQFSSGGAGDCSAAALL